ncbi:Hpt domain-containing protein [Bradyrhizobium sp. LHD-71]|uniref:Hpt domain-containing protein n=1 Tax=Bradyrhizobium sp. LHD-71 TaxID=3072141 RepID=UPI00280D4410|nr:Hpt domain-containing protein [Bradyrhizobium sp. LHD-71]MDQ8726547.1 Hpt domain-containing protein [Bradyrhizobium sp. LHD-71]
MTARERDTTAAKIEVETFPDHQIIRQPNPLRRAVKRVAENPADDPVARAEKALDGLSDEFEGWMRQECERLAAAHAAILKKGLNRTAQDELFRAAHDIKGAAATFGYPMAAAAADSLCRIMEHAPDFATVPNELIAHHVNAIQAIVREHRRFGVASVADELSRKLRGVADEYLTAVNQDRPEHLELILGPSIIPAE